MADIGEKVQSEGWTESEIVNLLLKASLDPKPGQKVAELEELVTMVHRTVEELAGASVAFPRPPAAAVAADAPPAAPDAPGAPQLHRPGPALLHTGPTRANLRELERDILYLQTAVVETLVCGQLLEKVIGAAYSLVTDISYDNLEGCVSESFQQAEDGMAWFEPEEDEELGNMGAPEHFFFRNCSECWQTFCCGAWR